MGEAPERVEEGDGNSAGESLEDFRKEIHAEDDRVREEGASARDEVSEAAAEEPSSQHLADQPSEGGERPGEGDLEDFRRQIQDAHEDDERGAASGGETRDRADEKGGERKTEAEEDVDPQNGSAERDTAVPVPAEDELPGGKAGEENEQPSDDELEESRKQVAEEYRPEGLGEDTPGGRFNAPVEDRIESADENQIENGIEAKQSAAESSTESDKDFEAREGSNKQVAAGALGDNDSEVAKAKADITAAENEEVKVRPDSSPERKVDGEVEASDKEGKPGKDDEAKAGDAAEGAPESDKDSAQGESDKNASAGAESDDLGGTKAVKSDAEAPKDEPQQPPAQIEKEDAIKGKSENLREVPAPTEPQKAEAASGASKPEDAAEPPAKIESYNRNDEQVLSVAHDAPSGHEKEPEIAQTPDLHRLQTNQSDFPTRGTQKVEAMRVPETLSEKGATTPGDQLGHGEGVRYNRNDNQIVVTEPERGRHEPDDVVRTAVEYMRSTALLVPESKIPSHTRDDVIAVTVAREREGWDEHTLYCRHTPGQDKAYLNLRQLDAEFHEQFRIRRIEIYSIEAFADDYNTKRPVGLENTEMVVRREETFVRIEGKEIPLNTFALRAQEGKAVLDARLGDSQIKIMNGVEGSMVRLGDHSRVTGMQIKRGDVVLSYQRTEHDPHPHQRAVLHLPVEARVSLPEGTLSREGRARVREIEGGRISRASLEVDERLRKVVETLLESAPTPDSYKRLKGDIAEELVREQLVGQLGLEVVADHPFNYEAARQGGGR